MNFFNTVFGRGPAALLKRSQALKVVREFSNILQRKFFARYMKLAVSISLAAVNSDRKPYRFLLKYIIILL